MNNFEALQKGGTFNILPILFHKNADGKTIASPPNQPEVSLTPRDLLNKLGQAWFDSLFSCSSEGAFNPGPFAGILVLSNISIPGGTREMFEEGVDSAERLVDCGVELD